MAGETISRRALLRGGAAATALAAVGASRASALTVGSSSSRTSMTAALKGPGHVPDPSRALGIADESLPFDHIVIAMMENHSFDNYLGMLPRSGQPKADGFTFDDNGKPLNWNPLNGKQVPVYHETTGCGTKDSGSQSWNDTHTQIDRGRMDGFAHTGPGSMGYWTSDDLPFYYSLAKTFTLANRWFCSAPCQTYPNRRMLMAGTAYGNISTTVSSLLDAPPPNGTIWDRLTRYGVSWRNYFTDAPSSAIILDTIEKHPLNMTSIAQFYVDCALGTLPSVSLVDCDWGVVTGEVGGLIPSFPVPLFNTPANALNDTAQSEENPQVIQLGEAFMAGVVNAVLQSPAWHRTMLIWLYDEHGGYYDHVPPPGAIKPDNIAPELGPSLIPGAYNIYGPRVPAVVVSPYSKPKDVTNVLHDHTSILATIEAKWNLPALTYRDANATTMLDFLDLSRMSFADPPELAAPANPLPPLVTCYAGQPEPPGA